MQINGNRCWVHFSISGDQENEWVDINSKNISPFRSHTVQSPNSPYLSPYPMSKSASLRLSSEKSDFNDILSELLNNLGQICAMIQKIVEMKIDDIQVKELDKRQELNQNMITGIVDNSKKSLKSSDQQDNKSQKSNMDDATSQKSFKSMKSDKFSIDYETSSIKSMKSDISRFTQFHTGVLQKPVEDNITEEEYSDEQD